MLSRLVISTDCENISAVARCLGVVVIQRPDELSTDTCRIDSAVKHALLWCERFSKARFDYVVLLQGSTIGSSALDIDNCCNLLISHWNKDCCVSMSKVAGNPLYKSVLDGLEPVFDDGSYRRQDRKTLLVPDGGIYVVKRDYLLEHERVIADKIIPYISPRPVVDIHYPLDLRIADLLLEGDCSV